MSRRVRNILLVLVVIAVATTLVWVQWRGVLVFGLERAALLRDADRVVAYRVYAPRGDDIDQATEAGLPPPVTRREIGATLSRAQHSQLRELLLDWRNAPAFWMALGRKRCLFHPDADFELLDSNGRLLGVITLCFGCEMWRFTQDSSMSEGDFDGTATALRRLVAEVLIDDTGIPVP